MLGAEILTRAMSESGTSVIFSLSGNQIMPIYDACLAPGIRIVHVRHENAAVFMADACAQVSSRLHSPLRSPLQSPHPSSHLSSHHPHRGGRADGLHHPNFGVSLVTAGPGFANALGGLYSALMAESPVILISGDAAVAQDGKRAFQELSQITASAPFVKHAVRVTDAGSLAETWFECVSIATSGRPGPVHLVVPFDVLQSEVSENDFSTIALKPEPPSNQSNALAIPRLADTISALHAAKRPVVLTGPSMTASRLHNRLASLQEVMGLPVIAMESPRGLADPSLGKVKDVIKQADCVLLLGKLPDFTLGFCTASAVPADTLIVVDAESQSLQQSMTVLAERATRGVISVHCDPQLLLDALAEQYVRTPDHNQWHEQALQQLAAPPLIPESVSNTIDAREPETVRLPQQSESKVGPGLQLTPQLTPREVGNQVQKAIDHCEQSVLICDGGEFGQWAQACVRSDIRVINGPSGAIGGSLPQAVAAKIACPESMVFTMLGDGTAGFHLAELETSVREQAPIIVIIGNDSRWNAEYQIQLRDYGADRLHSCELGQNIRYDLAAVGLGCYGEMVQSETGLGKALAAAIKRCREEGQTTCINVSMSGWPAPVFG